MNTISRFGTAPLQRKHRERKRREKRRRRDGRRMISLVCLAADGNKAELVF